MPEMGPPEIGDITPKIDKQPILDKKKRNRRERKQEWSIDEWLEASMERQRRILKRRAKAATWPQKLKGDIEFVISSPDYDEPPKKGLRSKAHGLAGAATPSAPRQAQPTPRSEKKKREGDSSGVRSKTRAATTRGPSLWIGSTISAK